MAHGVKNYIRHYETFQNGETWLNEKRFSTPHVLGLLSFPTGTDTFGVKKYYKEMSWNLDFGSWKLKNPAKKRDFLVPGIPI